MKLAYADPPYPGCAHLYKDHPDYAGEVDHEELLLRLSSEYAGWVLHTSSTALDQVMYHVANHGIACRVMAWVKPFAAYKRNVSVAYAWEPVLVSAARKPEVTDRIIMRDWTAESITMKKGLTGAKPPAVCRWLFEMMGAWPSDTLHDLYPGTGAVTEAWKQWCSDVDDPTWVPPKKNPTVTELKASLRDAEARYEAVREMLDRRETASMKSRVDG